ncbi:hypothetical protein ABRZ80_20595 [Vibrio vulnificus]|uniref:hypothetical protein n=1 Tax=Vibrio vulnificus TaxID=672 RepID=UPI0032ECC2C7|nr:hypothetical protein [Vibrio navarrensis]
MKQAMSVIFVVAAFSLYVANYGFSVMSDQLSNVDEFVFTYSLVFFGMFTLMTGLGFGILMGRKI